MRLARWIFMQCLFQNNFLTSFLTFLLPIENLALEFCVFNPEAGEELLTMGKGLAGGSKHSWGTNKVFVI